MLKSKSIFLGPEGPGLWGLAPPTVQVSFAPWLGFVAPDSAQAWIRATMRDTLVTETFVAEFVRIPSSVLLYQPASTFDLAEYRRFIARIDRSKPVELGLSENDDPATYRILDGDLRHLNDSVQERYFIDLGDGKPIQLGGEPTLAWAMTEYLRAAIGGINEAAFLGDPDKQRRELYGWLDTLGLLISGGDFSRALEVNDQIISMMDRDIADNVLDPAHPSSESTACAFRKMRNLLQPGSLVCP